MNFTFEEEDIVRHKFMGEQDLVVSKTFRQAKHVVMLKAADGTVYRALTRDLIRIRRPKDEAALAQRQAEREARRAEREKEEAMIEARKRAFQRHVEAGGRLTADGLPDRRVTKLRKKTKDGRGIIWIGRR